MSRSYTIPEKLLLSALKVRESRKTFSAEDLVVQAWKSFPDSFGLAGYSDSYPDSNRILTNIMGTKGMRGKGWLRKVGEKQYRLTSKALEDGALLLSRDNDGVVAGDTFLRAELHRETGAMIERLLSTNAARKALGFIDGEVSFTEACGFWDISARSNANTLVAKLSEVESLLDRVNKALESGPDGSGLQLSTESLTRTDVDKLEQMHKNLQLKFKTELDVLRLRTDERSGKKKRSPV